MTVGTFRRYGRPRLLRNGCLEWCGRLNNKGYGMVGARLAHRVAWELANGPIPPGSGYHGTCVLHKCDFPRCVNAAHLFLGTQVDNMRDKARKGRAALPSAKLNPDEARDIRLFYEMGTRQAELAREYGVTRQAIHSIVHGRCYSY